MKFPLISDHQSIGHCYSEEAGQASPSDYAHHGQRVAALPEEDRHGHCRPREALSKTILGRVTEGINTACAWTLI